MEIYMLCVHASGGVGLTASCVMYPTCQPEVCCCSITSVHRSSQPTKQAQPPLKWLLPKGWRRVSWVSDRSFCFRSDIPRLIPWSLLTTHASYPPWNARSSGPGCGAQDYLWLQRDGPVSVGQAAPPLALNTVFLSCGCAGCWLPTDTLHCRHILSPGMRKSPLSSLGTNVNDGCLFKVLWSLEGGKML